MTQATNSPLKTRRLLADAAGIAEAARMLGEGALVAFPTETVYGLGALASDPVAVARLFAAKARPSFNPLIAHVLDVASARSLGDFDGNAERFAAKFWPGALTLVVRARPDCPVCELARAGLDTVALRVPAHPVARALLAALGKPVAAPSANRSGHVSPTTAEHVIADLSGAIDAVLDGGPTPLGIESTIIDCTSAVPRLLRVGGIPRAEIERVLGGPLAEPAAGEVTAPGMLASHYAPRAKLLLDVAEVRPDEALLTFGAAKPKGIENTSLVLDLSSSGDLVEAAANLFAHLRALDATGTPTIAVAPIPHEGLGEAINDRLGRAAAPRR
ncbi:MAG TPA: L-threonylcarbamoyladenylate synthase [Xanthobacteraceae bacterium]|jgi:L-threonylcarbamoyladenylate synthase